MLTLTDFLKEIEKKVTELLPQECNISSMEIEGPDIVIYTKNIDKFLDDESLIKTLATTLKKRFVIRSDTKHRSLFDSEVTSVPRVNEIVGYNHKDYVVKSVNYEFQKTNPMNNILHTRTFVVLERWFNE